MYLPQFIKQKSYEKIEYILHRHPITFVPVAALFIILLAVPVAVYFLINSLFPTILAHPLIYPPAVLAASVYYLSIYLFFYGEFIDFYLDLWIVTSDRIIDIEQHGLFSRIISEMDLYRTQDVTVNIKGFIPTIFNYGTVNVKTAAADVDIIFSNIPDPNKIRQALIHLAEQDRKYHHAST